MSSRDVIFDDFVTENLQIFHSDSFQWYYLPDQNTWEVLIFKSGDKGARAGRRPPTLWLPQSEGEG